MADHPLRCRKKDLGTRLKLAAQLGVPRSVRFLVTRFDLGTRERILTVEVGTPIPVFVLIAAFFFSMGESRHEGEQPSRF